MQAAGEHWLPVLQATGHAVDVMETMSTTAYYIIAEHFAAADLRLVPGRQGTRVELHSGFCRRASVSSRSSRTYSYGAPCH